MSRSFLQSRYLRFVPRADGLAVYHSLFGNLALIDEPGRELLDAFSRPATIPTRSCSGKGSRPR